MIKGLKKLLLSMLAGASCVTAMSMLAVGYSDHINPADHPMAACLGMAFPAFVVANLIVFGLWLIVKWKWAWIPLVGFALAYVPIKTYFPIHVGDTPPDGCIKVMTYNVCVYGGNHRYDNAPEEILNYMKRVNADIVCIQEDHTTKLDHFSFFKELYPYTDTVHVGSSAKAMISAIGIRSRFPVVKKERIDYESECNGSMAFYLAVDADTIIVINNHLESTHLSDKDRKRYKDVLKGNMEREEAEDETVLLIEKLSKAMETRSYQARAVHDYIEAHRRYPIIVCGDFNDTPISYTRRTIAQGLQDCFAESGCGAGISFNTRGFNFRIDYILCSDHFAPYKCTVDDQADYSDHYPVYCWLKWKKSNKEEN